MTAHPRPGSAVVVHAVSGASGGQVRCRVDGHEVQLLPSVGSGSSTLVPVAPGQHMISCYGIYQLVARYGEAELVVDVPPGGQVDVHYALPRTSEAKGMIGLVPQQRSAAPHARTVLTNVAMAVVVVLVCGGGAALWQLLQDRA